MHVNVNERKSFKSLLTYFGDKKNQEVYQKMLNQKILSRNFEF